MLASEITINTDTRLIYVIYTALYSPKITGAYSAFWLISEISSDFLQNLNDFLGLKDFAIRNHFPIYDKSGRRHDAIGCDL